MKITKRQLRRIIKEAMGNPEQDKRMYDTIIDNVPMRGGGIEGAELVDIVNQEHRDIPADRIYDFLDELEADHVLNYDSDMDEWSLRTR